MNSSNVGSNVRLFRTARGLGQADLARLSQVPAPRISMLETGGLALDPSSMRAIARALDCSVDRLQSSGEELLASRPWLRAYADAPKRSVSEYVADSQVAVESAYLARLRPIPDAIPLFEDDLDNAEAIEEQAMVVREAAGLSSNEVVPNVIRAAERLGCMVLPMESELGRHLGLSIRVANKPVIRVSRSSEESVPGDRQRFTVAHELGHLSLHYDLSSPATTIEATRIEKQAHRFAAAFLVPGEALLEDLEEMDRRVTLTTLLYLKEKWGFSVKAFVGRIKDLGLIDESHARSLYKQISARKWNKKEPIQVMGESAKWLQQAIAYSGMQSGDTVEQIAQMAGIGVSYFENWMSWQSSASDTKVIDFPKRTTQ